MLRRFLNCLPIILLALLVNFNLIAQDLPIGNTPANPSGLDSLEAVIVECCPPKPDMHSGATAKVLAKNFNQGIINDPWLLLQGRVVGLQVYNRGGDPNGVGVSRIRGVNTFVGDAAPLVVLDGIPGASLNNVDPNDIASIEVLKDGSAAAKYGMRGAGGVLLVNTKSGSTAKKKLSLSYFGNVGLSTSYPGITIMTADEFRAVGGLDLGSDTDWLSEITNKAISHTHGLAASGKIKNTSYRLSGNARAINGTLNNTGFDLINTRLSLSNKSLNDKLDLKLNASFTNRKQQLGFLEAFRYAKQINPTAPVLATDAPYFFNGAYYGGYFETVGLFDNYNPVSIIEQNLNNSNNQELLAAANAGYNLTEDLSIHLSYAHQKNFNGHRAYYAPTSLFRGNAGWLGIQGSSNLLDLENSFNALEASLKQSKTLSKGELAWTVGFAHQQFKSTTTGLNILGTNDINIVELDRVEEYTVPEGAYTSFEERQGTVDNLQAMFASASMDFNRKLFLNASFRREGTSKLSEDNEWANFLSAGVASDLSQFIGNRFIDILNVRVGYGITGLAPRQSGLSEQTIRIYNRADGSKDTSIVHGANRDLVNEKNTELNFGIDFKIHRFSGAIELYDRNSNGLILLKNVDPEIFGAFRRYENVMDLNTKGIELSLDANILQRKNVAYSTTVLFSKYKSTVKKYIIPQDFVGDLGGPGQCCTQPLRIKEDAEFGEFWGVEFVGVDAEGLPIFADLNGNGVLETNGDLAGAESNDFKVIGNATPDFELGWNNKFSVFGWKVNTFFRGAFGHSLFNSPRLFNEPIRATTSNYNFVNTTLAQDGLVTSRFSSLFVEKANFFKLDNLVISRTIPMGKIKAIKKLTLSLAAQNLFVWTKYTGADPEPALVDVGTTNNGASVDRNSYPNALVPGMDRRNHYIPYRTFSLGLNLDF